MREPRSMMYLAGMAAREAMSDLSRQLRCPSKEIATLLAIGAICAWFLTQYCTNHNLLTGADLNLSPRMAQDM